MCFKLFCCCDYGDNAIRGDSGNVEANPAITSQPILSGYYKLFAKECLDEHNRYRALHGVPLITLNPDLSAYATEWARILADRDMVLIYRSEAIYGENLFVAREYNVDARTVVKSWYDEINSYNFSKPERVHGVDQFTQMIWRDTKDMGVGIEKRGQNTWIVVNYYPKGNISGEFGHNVLKPTNETALF